MSGRHGADQHARAQLDRLDEARAALKDFLAVSPNYTVTSGRAGIPFRDEQVLLYYMEGLIKAGLPEVKTVHLPPRLSSSAAIKEFPTIGRSRPQ